MIGYYVLVWALTFIWVNLLDALWHVVLFKGVYLPALKPVARQKPDGSLAIKGLPGIASQVLVVTAYVVLVLLAGMRGYGAAALLGGVVGTLAISVWGLVNDAFIAGWDSRITWLELVWGPIVGVLSGLFVRWVYFVLV